MPYLPVISSLACGPASGAHYNSTFVSFIEFARGGMVGKNCIVELPTV